MSDIHDGRVDSRYKWMNAKYKIEGYIILDRTEKGFVSAKAECIKNLENDLESVMQMTFIKFSKLKDKS